MIAPTTRRALLAGAGVLVAGGLALGLAPPPLADFGCSPALLPGGQPDGQDTGVVLACAEQRGERQDLVAGLVVIGLATAAGAHASSGRSVPRLRPAPEQV